MNDNSNGGAGKHKRRSLAMDSLLREASQFLKSGQPGINSDEAASINIDLPLETSQQPPDGLRRSTRRLTQACKNNLPSTPMRSTYHHAAPSSDGEASSSSHSFSNLCDDSMIQPSSPRDMFGAEDSLLEVEMESLNIKTRPHRTACRKRPTKVREKITPENTIEQETISANCMEATFSGTFLAVCESSSSSSIHEMEIEGLVEAVDPDLVALYTNQNFVKPENSGLETIDEVSEELAETEGSPIKSKRPRGVARKKTAKAKQPWRFIPHLVVNPPEIWWQEAPLKKQAECRKKARELGYRPATKKRLLDAEKKVQVRLEELDRHITTEERVIVTISSLSASTADNSLQEKGSPIADAEGSQLSITGTPGESSFGQLNESTFNSLKVFVGDSSQSSSLSSSPLSCN